MASREKIAAELRRPAWRGYERRKVILKGLNDMYQVDLIEMIPFARVNKGHNIHNDDYKLFLQSSVRGTYITLK